MIRIGILGNIGSGKSYVAKNFGYPVFNADNEVVKLYREDKKVFHLLNKKLPQFITKFPIDKTEITKAILSNKNNLKKIIKIYHKEIKVKMQSFLKKNKNKKIVLCHGVFDLLHILFNKKDLLVFVDSKKKDIDKRIKKRPKFNSKLFRIFKKIQFSPSYKKKKSHFIIKNTFTKKPVKNEIMKIINKIL